MIKPARCVGCPLETHGAVGYTRGNKDTVLLVAQSPGREEIKYGKILIGPSGKLLDSVFKVVGIDRTEINLANALGCMEGKDKSAAEISEALKHCRPYLVNFINKIKPSFIISCGAYALKTILGKEKITAKRGKIFQSKEFDCPVLVTLHPAAVLRECTKEYPNKPYEAMNMRERDFLNDFRAAQEAIQGELWKSVGIFWETDDPKERDRGKKLVREIDTSGYHRGTEGDSEQIAMAKFLSVDVELDKGISEDANLLSLSCSMKPTLSCVFSANSIPSGVRQGLASNSIKIVAARPFDENILEDYGIPMGGKKYDVLTMAHVLDENYHKYTLETVAATYADMHNIKDIAGGYRENLGEADEETVINYNGVDTDAALRSFTPMYKLLKNEPRLFNYYENFIIPVQDVLAKIIRNGCPIDRTILTDNITKARLQLDEFETKMIEMVPESILSKHRDKLKFSRSAFIKDIVFNGLGCKPNKKFVTAVKKEPQITEEHLKEFSETTPFIPLYLQWNKLTKIINTYLTPLQEGTFIHRDNRIYPGTVLNRTVTGRSVILEPPMQTYPQHGEFAYLIKECIVPEDGWILGYRDLSQSELRVAGWRAKDKNILKAIRNGIDLHVNTATIIAGVKLNQVTDKMRRDAKPINFGLIYGLSPESLQDYARNEYNLFIPLDDCRKIRERFFSFPDGYFGLPDYYNEINDEVIRTGFIEGILGRRRRFPSCKGNPSQVGAIIRQAINFPIQNFSSDLTFISLVIFYRMLVKMKLTHVIKPMWVIHDSIIFQAREDYYYKAMEYLKLAMEELSVGYIKKYFGVNVDYPIESDGKVGISWEDMG